MGKVTNAILYFSMFLVVLFTAGCTGQDFQNTGQDPQNIGGDFQTSVKNHIVSLQDTANDNPFTRDAFVQSHKEGFINAITKLSKEEMKSAYTDIIKAERKTNLDTCQTSSGDYDELLESNTRDILSGYGLSEYPDATKIIILSLMAEDQKKGDIRSKTEYSMTLDQEQEYMRSIGCNN